MSSAQSTATLVRRRFSPETRKQQIVETVLDLVASRGAEAVSTQVVADEIGITQPAIFKHFPTKEAMWLAVLDWLDEQLASIHRRAEDHADIAPLDMLGRMFLAHAALVERHPALAKLVFADHLRLQYPSLNKRFARIHEAYRVRVAELIERAKARNDVAATVASAHAATLYFCMIQGLGFQAVIARLPINLRKEARQVFGIYLRGIAQK